MQFILMKRKAGDCSQTPMTTQNPQDLFLCAFSDPSYKSANEHDVADLCKYILSFRSNGTSNRDARSMDDDDGSEPILLNLDLSSIQGDVQIHVTASSDSGHSSGSDRSTEMIIPEQDIVLTIHTANTEADAGFECFCLDTGEYKSVCGRSKAKAYAKFAGFTFNPKVPRCTFRFRAMRSRSLDTSNWMWYDQTFHYSLEQMRWTNTDSMLTVY